MTKRRTNGSVPAFGDFLAYLRLQGFRVGLDHYVRLQELFERMGSNRDPDELRTLLCPLFATSRKQQERFYEAFDNYAELVQISPPPPPPREPDKTRGPESKKQTPRQLLYLAGAGSLLTLVLIGLALGVIPTPSFLKGVPQPSPEVTPKPNTTPTATPSSSPTATVPDGSRTVPLPVTPQPTNTPPADISSEEATPPAIKSPPPARFYLVVISGLLAIFLLWELYRLIRRKLFLRRQSVRRPPSIWPIRVEAPSVKLYDSEDFYRAARLMRRRQVAEYHRLDVPATVAATITARGYPSFRYKPDSKAPEYLVLIDRASFRDHQAQLFNELIRAFEREGLFVVRYFYEGDPRVCCDDKGENCIHLSELQNQYVGHRLLIFGNGDKLLDPITGRLAAWTSMFLDWQDRAVLTPEARWELREFSLSSQFVVLPATLDGLMALVDHFDTMVTTDPRIWSPAGLQIPPADLDENTSVEVLKSYLGEQAFQWLCACAVYPELQWNLTLFLGSLGCMSPTTVREQNLLRLIRLPWFRNGSLADAMRWPLINQLGETREREVRAAIIHLLEKSPAPAGTLASDKYELELAVQHWRLEQDDESLNELRRVMGRLTPGQILKDQTLVRYLERMSNPVLDLALPRRLRKYFFRSGIPLFGLKTGVRFGITLLLIAIASILIKTQTIPVPHFLQDPVASPSVDPTETVIQADQEAGRRAEEEAKRRMEEYYRMQDEMQAKKRAEAERMRREAEQRRRLEASRPTRSPSVSSPVSPGPAPGVPGLIPSNPSSSPKPGDILGAVGLVFVKIPGVKGDKPETALQELRKLGLEGVLKERADCGNTGRVLDTEPGKDQRVPPGTTVTVYVSSTGDNYAIVPKLTGLLVRDAEQELKGVGLGSRTRIVETASSQPDTILRQNPVAGTRMLAGCSVELVTAVPPQLVTVPNYIGLSRDEALRRLPRFFGETVRGSVIEVLSDLPPGTVVEQSPKAGVMVPRGTSVNLAIAQSRRTGGQSGEMVSVPNVVGKFLSAARRTLSSAGLTIEVVEEDTRIVELSSSSLFLLQQVSFEYDNPQGEKKVVRQDPGAGTKVPKGSPVRIWVR